MAEIISTASFDIDTTKATKNVDALVGSIDRLDKELQQLQKEGKDTAAVEAQIAQQTAQLNRALSQTATTTKGAAAQTAAFTKAQKDLAGVSATTAQQVEKTNISVRQSASVFRRGVAGAKALGKGISQDLGGALNAAKGGIQGFGDQIAGVAASFGGWGLAIAGAVTVLTPFVAGLFEAGVEAKVAAEQQQALRDSIGGAITQIAAETQVSNGLFNELNNVNTSSARRVEVVNELNEKYPQIIGNTNLLTASEQELRDVQRAVNDGIRQRILAQAQAQLQAEIVAKIASNQVIIEQELNKRGIDAVKIRAEEAAAIDRINKAYEAEVERLQQLAVPYTKAEAQRKASIDRERQLADLREKNAGNLDFYAREFAAQAAAENRELKNQLKTLKGAFDATDATLRDFDFGAADTAALAKNAEKAKTVAKEAEKRQQALAGTLAALRAEQAKLNKEIEENTRLDNPERLKELVTQRENLNRQIKIAEEDIAALARANTDLNGSLSSLEKSASEIQGLLQLVDPTDTVTIQNYQIQLAALNRQIKAVKKTIDDAAIVELLPPERIEQSVEAGKQLRAEIEATRIAISDLAIQRNRALISLQSAENAAIAKVGDNEQEKERIRKEFAVRREEIERAAAADNLRLQIQIGEAEVAQIQNQTNAEVSAINEQIAKVEELRLELAKLEGEPVEVKIEANTKGIKQKTKEAILFAANVAEELGGQIVDFVSNANQQALQAADNAVAKQQQILDDLLANRETANAQQVELERERLDKLNAEREKAKDKEAVIAQAQIAINLALAVARAVAEGGAVASFVTVGLALSAAVFGFLKAKQASEQAFFDGTLYAKRGKGEKAGRDTIKARLNEGEAVIPTATNREYHPAVSAIYNGTVPADALNAFVTDYQTGRVSRRSLGAVRAVSDGTPQVIVVQPDESIGKHVAKEIQKMPQMQLRGEGLYRIVNTKSGKLLKTQKRSRGY